MSTKESRTHTADYTLQTDRTSDPLALLSLAPKCRYNFRLFIRPLISVIFFFFFSSRRRHTRLTCDWSSDVCSSDLVRYTPNGSITFALETNGKMVGVSV